MKASGLHSSCGFEAAIIFIMLLGSKYMCRYSLHPSSNKFMITLGKSSTL